MIDYREAWRALKRKVRARRAEVNRRSKSHDLWGELFPGENARALTELDWVIGSMMDAERGVK